MAKKEEKRLLFSDYFGSYKDYFIFLIRSNHSFYPFGALISQLCGSPVAYIGNVDTEAWASRPVFRILYSLVCQQDQTEIFIVENKTSEYKDPPATRILSLFETYHYIANKQPPFLVSVPAVDYDFLILLSKDTDYAAAETLSLFRSPSRFHSLEITEYIHPDPAKGKKKKTAEFFQRLFQSSSIQLTEFQEEQEKNILGVTEIPAANWNSMYRFPPPELDFPQLYSLRNAPGSE